jgi:hypothetical protein
MSSIPKNLAPKNLTPKDIPIIRKKILNEDQDGKCLICGNPPTRPCLDHHHKKKVKGTGKIRGVLCSNCNVFLAKIENNCRRYAISHDALPDVLRNIADYLEKEQYNMIHPSDVPLLKKSSYNALKRAYNGKKKFPAYPRSKKMTKALEALFEAYNIEPEYYS